MSGINRYDAEGVLTLGGFSMNRPAWALLGLSRLLVEVDKRGANRVLPGAAGVVTLPLRNTETRHNFTLVVTGDTTVAGAPLACSADCRDQLILNLDAIYDTVVNVTGVQAGSWTVFGQAARTADVQVLGMREQRIKLRPHFAGWIGTFEINVPGGRFE